MAKHIYTNGAYFKKNPQWHAADSRWKAGKIAEIIRRNRLQPRTICEVGCGAGEILNQLCVMLDDSIQYHGYEISPQAFTLCRAKSRERLRFTLGDVFTDCRESFDLIMAIDVIEHIEEYYTFLRRLRSRAPYKILHIPLDLSVFSVLRSKALIHKRDAVGHIHYFTADTALAVLRDTGYTVIDSFYTANTIDLPLKSILSALALLPRKIWFKLSPRQAARILGGFSLLVLAG